ncbi:putative selenoprotein S isoform X2 [Apostichopus japonicus]|uniref:Putative selenoprotein S isoform X2 n=1 Tax=Stichopus japonicus TaxID=307972 RepID=A0A2G8KH07_STIJA|nr:putative selenoprotein S isoform X2 [Apostichopus japonicus]
MADVEDGLVEIEPDDPGNFIEEPDQLPEKVVPQPESGAAVFAAASDFLALYGWYILFAVLGIWYIRNRYSSQLNSWQQQREDRQSASRYNASEVLDRQEAIEKARRKLQEQHDQKAKEYAEKQKLKEEEKRKAEIEDWERHKQGRGYKSKKKVEEDNYPTSNGSGSSKPKPKKPLREGFNPLAGDIGGGFRAQRRNFSRGG